MSNFLKHQAPHANKHTRRTFAGNFDENNNKLIIGITGNHKSDRFERAIGREIAQDRALVEKNYLKDQGKQLIINNVTKETAKTVFFDTINKL